MKKLLLLMASTLVAASAMATQFTGSLFMMDENYAPLDTIENYVLDMTIADNGITAVTFGENTPQIGAMTFEGAPNTNGRMKAMAYMANIGDAQYQVVARTTANFAYVTLTYIGESNTYNFVFDNTGDGFQIPNSNFETWTDNTTEPKNWHGFNSASGSLASMAKGKVGQSTDCHSGSYSAVITAGATNLGFTKIVNNGTMTNGRLNAGSATASDPANHSEMNVSSTATDKNGEPFYTALYGRPDAISAWMKFTQKTAQSTYKYMTISAIVFDGNYYQDPEDNTYNNVVAKAKRGDITTCGWTKFEIPFTEIDGSVPANAILVTISTNATPAKGSDGDQVFVDDMELIYKYKITGVTYKGVAVQPFQTMDPVTEMPSASDFAISCEGAGALTGVHIIGEANDGNYLAICYSISADLKNYDAFPVIIPKAATAITLPEALDQGGDVKVKDTYVMHVAPIDNGGVAYLTDGENSWVKATMPQSVYDVVKDANGLSVFQGTMSNLNTNPEVFITAAEPDAAAVKPEITTVDMIEHINAQPNGIYKVSGYIDDNYRLRAYSGQSGAMGQSLEFAPAYDVTSLEKFRRYNFTAIFTIKEPWTNLQAPQKITRVDEDYFTNYLILPISYSISTGVEDVDAAATVTSVRYYNIAGVEVGEAHDGIVIAVKTMSNGETKVEKIIK